MFSAVRYIFFLSLLFPLPCEALAARLLPPQTALAMVGEPLYPPGFSSFSFVNPDAPKGGTLKLGLTGTFDSLNPFIVRGLVPYGLSLGTMPFVFESMMMRGLDEPFTLYGLIAKTVEVAEDRSEIVFNLNEAAHFSDGRPVTADDVLFSFETLRDKGRPNHRTYYRKVTRVEKLSPMRVRFVFGRDENGIIDREMPLIIGLMAILPKHDWTDRDFNETRLSPPIGSGPYRVSSVDVGRGLVYERNPNYWAKDFPVTRGLFNADKIQIDYYRDDNVCLQAFKAGQFDVRRETDPTKWVTAYDFPAVRDGHVRLEKLEHGRVEPAYGYILNTRRALFSDPVLREALQDTFDFDWVNRNLFHGQYKRVDSFYPNSTLAARGVPSGLELDILEVYRDRLPPDLFTDSISSSEAVGRAQFRDNLVKAEMLLKKAGYKIVENKLYTPSGKPVLFEIMLSDPVEEKVALAWAASLKRLGIEARVHTVDSAQYQTRVASFDFEVTANRWMNSLSPGNEQVYYFGSLAAGQNGSRNYAGIKDPVVDALAARISNVSTREELVATARALDRVLLRGHYLVPLYYQKADDMASWMHVRHPSKMSLNGNVLESWWVQE